MLNNFAENGGFSNNHGQAARSAEAQKPQNLASSWGYNSQLEGMYYGEQHQSMYMGTYGSGAKHPNYSQYPTGSIHQPVPTPVVKCMEACCQHYPINPAPLRYHQTNTDTRQYRTMQPAIPRKNTYPGIPERHYPPQYIGRGPALNVADSRQQMPMIRPQYPVYPPGYWENRGWVGPRMNCPPSYHQSVSQSAQLTAGLKIPEGSHYMDPNAQKVPGSQHRRVSSGSGGPEIIRPIPEPKRQILDHNPQSCYEYGYPTGFLPFNDVNKIQNGNLQCQNNTPSYKIPSDKQYHPHQMQYTIQHNERNVMNPSMYDVNYPMNYPLPSSNDPHLRPEAEESQHPSDTRKYDGSLSKKRPDLDLRQYLATWDDDEDDGTRVAEPVPATNSVAPYIVVDNRTLETDALGKLQEQLNSKSLESPAKGKDKSPICEPSAEEQLVQNNEAGRTEVHQTNYAPSMPTLLSDLDKNATPWNGISREGEGVIGKSGAFQPLDCSKRDLSFDNPKRDLHSQNSFHKLPVHTNDTSNLSFEHLSAPYYTENRRLDTYNTALEIGNRIVKNPDTTTSNYHHAHLSTNVSRPCDPRLQQSQGNNSSIYSKVTPKYPSTNNHEILKPNQTDGFYNYKHSMQTSKHFAYENQSDTNYDYHKYISDVDSNRIFENKDASKDTRRMYHQEMGKAVNGPFIEPYSKTSDSNSVLENSSYGLNVTRPESFTDSNVKDNELNHQLTPLQSKIHSPDHGITRNETQNCPEKSVLVTPQSSTAEIIRMPYCQEKETSQNDNVVTLHSADQAKDNAMTVEVPYVQQYSTLVRRLSEEINQTESSNYERPGVKSDDSNNKHIPIIEELKKPTSLKIKRLPNSEEWAVEENISNLASKKSTGPFDAQPNESSEKVDLLKMSVNVGSLNMPSLDDIRDVEDGSETVGENLTNKFIEETVCSSKTTNLVEEVLKSKPTVQVPQMAIVQPMKVLEPEPKCLNNNSTRKHDDGKGKEISFKRSYSNSYDLNQNNFSDKLLLNDIHHSKQSSFSKPDVSKHENFRTHKKIQRSHSDCFSSCLTEQQGSFIHSEDKLSLQSYPGCEINSNLREYYKIGKENTTEEKNLNTRMPSSPGVDGMFEDINHSSKDLLYRRKSCDYQETISHELTSLNSENHFQSFSNMFIDDMNRRKRSDGSVLQMSDRKSLKSQIESNIHQDLSQSFEEHLDQFNSHFENRTATSEKFALSKKSPPIPPINLKLIESKKIWCITNKEQHLNQPNCLYENSLENTSMCLDLNHIVTEPLDKSKNIEESLCEEGDKGSTTVTKVNDDNETTKLDEHSIENLLNSHEDSRLSREVTSESKTSELLVSSDFPDNLGKKCHEQNVNSTSPLNENKCLSLVKYYPQNKLIGKISACIENDACLKILVFDEKGNHFPECFGEAQEKISESEAVVFDILNDILTKSVHSSRTKENVDISKSGLSSNTTISENHSESVIKFDTSNKRSEKLNDHIAKTTEKFIQHEKENYQHYSVIKKTHLELASCIDLRKSSVRSIFSPRPDDEKCKEKYPNQSSSPQNGKVETSNSQANEVTHMDVDGFGSSDNAADSLRVENSQYVAKENQQSLNIDASEVPSNYTSDVVNTQVTTLLSNTEMPSVVEGSCKSISSFDQLHTRGDKTAPLESLPPQLQAENYQCSEQSSLFPSNLSSQVSSDRADLANKNHNLTKETKFVSESEGEFSSEIESPQVGNPLDNDLSLSPGSSSSESVTESDFSEDYKSSKDYEKHHTDCSSIEDEIMEIDDFEAENHVDNSEELNHKGLIPYSTQKIGVSDNRDLVHSEDRSQTSVIVRNKTCNSALFHDDQDYRYCFDCVDPAMPIDCSMKSIREKSDKPNSKVGTENLLHPNSNYSHMDSNDRSAYGEMNSQKNCSSYGNLVTKSNLECLEPQILGEKCEVRSVPDNVTVERSRFDETLQDAKLTDCSNDLKNLSKEILNQSTDESKVQYCTNENFFYFDEERTSLKRDHPSYIQFFKKRKWQKFCTSLDEPEIISNKPNSLERNFSIINFGTNKLYQTKHVSTDLKLVEDEPFQLNNNDCLHSKFNLNPTLNEEETHDFTKSSSKTPLELLENKLSSKKDDILRSNLKNDNFDDTNVSAKNNCMEDRCINVESSSDSKMESSTPLDSTPSSFIPVQTNPVNKRIENETSSHKRKSLCDSDCQEYDNDISNELSSILPVEPDHSSETVVSDNSILSDTEVNSHLENNKFRDVIKGSESNFNDSSTEVKSHKDDYIKEKDDKIQIMLHQNESASVTLSSPCSPDLNENIDESSKFKSTKEPSPSWNESDSSISSCEDSLSNKESVSFDPPKSEAIVFAHPLAETNVDKELIQSTSNDNNNELLNDDFNKISNFSSSTEICQEPNIEPSEAITSSIVTGKDVLFSSRFLQDEDEQFSNSELEPTVKERKGLPEEDDDDHDVRTDAIKESLRNNQNLSTETFPLQCLVEAALALENVDSKQMLLNSTPLSDGYCQTSDRFLKLPGTEILPNCYDEPLDDDKAVFNEHLLPIKETENSLTLEDKEVFSKFEETNYNLRASTRIVTSSSSNIIPYSKRKYCFKSKLNKINPELKPKSQNQIKDKNRPKKRKGFFSYPRSKRRKRICKDKQKSIPVPLQEIFDDNSSEINSEKEIARGTSEEKLGLEESYPDPNVKVQSESDLEDSAVKFSVDNSISLPYFSKTSCKNDFGGPLIIASKGHSSSEANLLCVQVDSPKIDSFPPDLNEELESIAENRSLFKGSKTVESDISSVPLGNSAGLVIIIEDLENIPDNKSCFEDQSKRGSDVIFGSVEDCTISKNNTEDCSTMLTTELSINESCICPPHYSIDGICENGLHKEKANELMESEHFISNTFINIEDTSYRKYSSCSNSDLLATNCYEEINEDDISNWPFVEEEVAEFESNPEASNTIPENGRKIELKCSLPWKKIFNISKTRKKKSKTLKKLSGLELGPANVEVRLKAPSSEWKVIGDFHEKSSPVVKVSRLILQRESETSSYSEKDSEEENENQIQKTNCFELQDTNVCKNDALVKDVINDEQWQPVVLLTRNKILDELNLSLDSKSSGKDVFSPQNMSTNDSENYEECLKELQNSLKEVQNQQSFPSFTKSSSFSSDDSFIKSSSDYSMDFNDCQGRKVKSSSYGTYSPSADNNTSINDILYSPSDPHFSPEQGFPHSNSSTLSKDSSSCIDDVFEESYENTRLSSYFTDTYERSSHEVRNEGSDQEKHSFLNETVDNTRSGFFNHSVQEITQTSFKVQSCLLNDLSAKNEIKENNLSNDKFEVPNLKSQNFHENQYNSNESKDTSCSKKLSCDNSIKVRRKMPKNFFVRRKIRKNIDPEVTTETSVSKADSDEVTMRRNSTTLLSSDLVQSVLTDKAKVDQETGLLGVSARVVTEESYDRPTNDTSPECENSRLQCIYDLDETSPASQHDFPPGERFEEDKRLREGGRGLKRPCEGHSKEDTKRRRKQSTSRSSCSECELQFDNKEELSRHNSSKHGSRKRELHHCLLCQRTFSSYRRHRLHIQGRSHRHLELTQRHAALAMYRRLTGRECPLLPPLSMSEQRVLQWRPSRTGYSHFYHAPTPLQALLQEQSSGTTEETRASEERLPND